MLQRMVMGRILDEIPIDKDRPAVGELVPRSDWYQWANPDASHLPTIPYFNVYGDISVIEERCAWLWCHEPATLFAIGDLAILAGTDDPFDVPGSGGARMLNGAPAAQNWQWRLSAEVEWTWWLDPTFLYVVGELLGRPENHFKLSGHLGDIQVADCQTGQSTELSSALLSIVRGRLTGDPYDCQP